MAASSSCRPAGLHGGRRWRRHGWPGAAAGLALLAGGLLGGGLVQAQAADEVLAARVEEPRAYGWRVGDVVRRVVHLRIPAGWQVDERSLPRPDQRGGALELRTLTLRAGAAADLADPAIAPAAAGATPDQAERTELGLAVPVAPAGELGDVLARAGAAAVQAVADVFMPGSSAGERAAALRGPVTTLVLDYQVFSAAAMPRALDLPTLVLLVEPPPGLAGATVRELRLPARPLWLAPLAGTSGGSRSGLGELRPDVGVTGLDTGASARRLVLSLALALTLLLLGVAAAALLRWRGITGRARPFALAQAMVARELGRRDRAGGALAADGRRSAALVALHQAFHHAAGRTLLPRDARGWALADLRYAPLADAIGRYFDAAADEFFAAPPRSGGTAATARAEGVAPARLDDAALLALARALARAERRGLASQGVQALRARAGSAAAAAQAVPPSTAAAAPGVAAQVPRG